MYKSSNPSTEELAEVKRRNLSLVNSLILFSPFPWPTLVCAAVAFPINVCLLAVAWCSRLTAHTIGCRTRIVTMRLTRCRVLRPLYGLKWFERQPSIVYRNIQRKDHHDMKVRKHWWLEFVVSRGRVHLLPWMIWMGVCLVVHGWRWTVSWLFPNDLDLYSYQDTLHREQSTNRQTHIRVIYDKNNTPPNGRTRQETRSRED